MIASSSLGPLCHLDAGTATRLTVLVRFYGLLDHELDEVIDFYPSREVAEAELAKVLGDEPGWVDRLAIVVVDFSGNEPVVKALSDGHE